MSDGYLHDEQGKRSSGRLAFWIAFPLVFLLVILDSVVGLGVISLSTEAYKILTTIFGGTLLWVMGPRVGQYLPGIFSGIANRFGNNSSKKDFGEEV